MDRKNRGSMLVLAAIVMIPQLLFWWVAPEMSAAHAAVYIGGTILTAVVAAVYVITYRHSSFRKTAGLLTVCGILEMTSVILCALLLLIHATIRSTVFAFLITALMYLIILTPMIRYALRAQRQGVRPAAFPADW